MNTQTHVFSSESYICMYTISIPVMVFHLSEVFTYSNKILWHLTEGVQITEDSLYSCTCSISQGKIQRVRELSDEATSLMLKACRTKINETTSPTTQFFRKWHSWYTSRGSHPF